MGAAVSIADVTAGIGSAILAVQLLTPADPIGRTWRLVRRHPPLFVEENHAQESTATSMSTKDEGSQQGNKERKKLAATDDHEKAMNATSIVDLAATNTSSSDDVDDDDDGLFDPPPKEDCALCLILFPNEVDQITYSSCCGKRFCLGCKLKNQAVLWWMNLKKAVKDPQKPPLEPTCPFCRADVEVSDEVVLQRLQKRMDLNDHWAVNNMAALYERGSYGLSKDIGKAMELWLRAVELGSADACWNIASQYHDEGALEHNPEKYKKFLKRAAKRGHVFARHNLGAVEYEAGTSDLAVQHWMISAVLGDDDSLKCIGKAYRNKTASKNQYEKAIRAHQKAKKEISSDERKLAEKVFDAGGNDISVLSESELAGLCGVRKAESALFSHVLGTFFPRAGETNSF